MSTISTPPEGWPKEIIGYAQPWIVSPGDTVDIKISSTEPKYTYRTVRLIQGVDLPHSPPVQSKEITGIPSGSGNGRYQAAHPGSYGVVDSWIPPSGTQGLELSLYFQPHLVTAGHTQTVVSTLAITEEAKSGFAVVLAEDGEVQIWVGTGKDVEVLKTGFVPIRRRWVELFLALDGKSVKATLSPVVMVIEKAADPVKLEEVLQADAVFATGPLLFAASYCSSPSVSSALPQNFFNGRIDSPSFAATSKGGKRVLSKYDFSRKMSSDMIVDVSGAGFHGTLVNAPTRAVKGWNWDGSEPDWTRASYGYGAIHFHEDDLDDACWDTDFSIRLPEDSRSGAYAVEVTAEDGVTKDSIVFFVRPTKATSEKVGAKVALVISTFTYLAYANERLYDQSRASAIRLGPNDSHAILKTEDWYKMERRTDLGLSCYDCHTDDSGVVYSSAKRPILNVRPGYIMWGFQRPREFSADLFMIGYMEREGIPYDIIMDHDLHTGGVNVVSRYNTLITGCHPEYPSLESYDAYTEFARRGGNLMYLGGNGFYWVSATDSARPWRLEVRRGDVGVGSYQLPAGERVHSLSGQHGALWRSRGRPCNGLMGIGFSAEGTGPGVPFARTELGSSSQYAWVFEGIPPDSLIGVDGFGGGASGDEIDKFDLKNGSPNNVAVLATSTGHPDEFGIVPEDTTFPIVDTLGTQTREIRSDMVLFETAGGGRVFSVGSINWYCSVGWDGYENTAAKVTGNVLKDFMKSK